MKYRENTVCFLIIIASGIFGAHAWLLAHNSYLFTDSDDSYSYFIAVNDNIRDGNLIPSWNPDAYGGNGEPLYFWHPFFAYLVSLIHYVDVPFFSSVDIAVPIVLISSGLAMFVLVKKITKTNFVSLIASISYMYVPYQFTDSHTRGDFGESSAFIFMPLVIYFLLRSSNEKQHITSLILGGISFTFLLLAHPLITYLFSIFVFIPFTIYRIIKNRSIKRIIPSLKIFGIFLGTAAYYWIPFLFEKNYIHSEGFAIPIPSFGPVDFNTSIFNALWIIRPQPTFDLFLGYTAVASIMIGIVFFHRKISILTLSLFTLFITFLMTKEGILILGLIPGIQNIQFPYRLEAITTLLTPVLLALIVKESYIKISKKYNNFRLNNILKFSITGILIFFIIINSFAIKQYNSEWDRGITKIAPEASVERFRTTTSWSFGTYVPHTVPSSYYSGLIGTYQPFNPTQYAVSGNFTLKIPTEYNILHNSTNPNQENDLTTEINSSITKWEVNTKSKNENMVIFRIFYYPGWNVYLDDNKIPANYDRDTGQILVDIPSGEHHLKIIFEDTLPRLLGKIITLLSAILLLSLFVIRYIKNKNIQASKNII